MSRQPGQPRLAELAFHLYRVALHPELLDVARQTSVRGDRLRVRVGLLRPLGHFVEVRDEGAEPAGVLTTLAAPLAIELPTEGRLDLRVVGSDDEAVLVERSRLDYEGGYHVERRDDYTSLATHLEHAPEEGFQRLIQRRGHPENPGAQPFSLLDVRLQGGLLETYAVHAFPDERSFLFAHGRWRVST
jgi:hypothetical protein